MAKILVVEDEPELRELVVEQLDDEGHETIEACNGQEALDSLAENTPDLILSDITMPIMDGYEFFQALKENYPEHAHTPFIYLTALSNREDELKGLRLGVDAYITKPIDFDLLLLRIETILRIYNLQKSLAEEERKPPAETMPRQQTEGPACSEPIDTPDDHRDHPIAPDQPLSISLEKVRQRFGAKWQEASDKILKVVEQLVGNHLGPDDVYSTTPTMDVTILFANLSPDQADAKVQIIHQEIWRHLFGEAAAETDDVEGEDTIARRQDPEAAMAAYKRLEQIHTYEDLSFTKLLSASGAPSKIVRLSLNRHFSDKIGKVFHGYRFDSENLINLQKIMFASLGEKFKEIQQIAKSALAISISFSIVGDEESRRHYAKHCRALEERMSGLLIIEITDIPDRFNAHLDALAPLPVGRRVQALELCSLEQVADLDMQQLHCSIVSMGYENAVQTAHDDQLHRFRQDLKRQGIKFYVKDVPDGALIEAQKMRADLYSMEK